MLKTATSTFEKRHKGNETKYFANTFEMGLINSSVLDTFLWCQILALLLLWVAVSFSQSFVFKLCVEIV